MPEKRKKDSSGGKNSKKAKSGGKDKDFTSYMLSNYASDVTDLAISGNKSDSSDDDSDAAGSAFPAFDLPSFGTFDDGDDEPADAKEEGDKGEGTSNNGIIFVSDPSQLPQPLTFTTPTLMNPLVLGKNSQQNSGQVLVMNSPATKGSKKMVSHVQPVVLPMSQTKASAPQQLAGPRYTSTPVNNKSGLRSFNKQVQITSAVGSQLRPGQNIRQPRSVNQGSTSVTNPSMSATNIMQQVMAAAQQAAKNIRAANAPPRPVMAPGRVPSQTIMRLPQQRQPQQRQPLQQQQQRAPFRNVRPVQNQRGGNFTASRAPGRPQPPRQIQAGGQQIRPLLNGNAHHGGARQAFQPGAAANDNHMDAAKKWKPYSDILNSISRRLTKESGRKLGINPQMQLNLKQMYTLLRRKFNTNQIYDMCLWDMEHPDASLLEIAITNAFS